MTHVDLDRAATDDDDFTPPVAVRVTARIEICPVCSKALKKHSTVELMECSAQQDADEDDEDNPCNRPGEWFMIQTQVNHEARVKEIFEARNDVRIHEVDEKHKLFPGYVLMRCELSDDLWRTVRSTPGVSGVVGTHTSRPSPMTRRDVESFLYADETKQELVEPPLPPNKPVFETFVPPKAREKKKDPEPVVVDAPTTDDDDPEAWISSIPFPTNSDGEVDYEKLVPLAAAMRTVLERERDEIIRRGGPIEKQNIELKERLAKMLDDMNTLRRKLQSTAEARNGLQAQVDAQTKTIRLLRNELKGRKESGNHQRVLEIQDLLDVAQKTKGWKVERTGGGHFKFLKNGIYVVDAASSGQGNKVNMATRVALRKAGLDV